MWRSPGPPELLEQRLFGGLHAPGRFCIALRQGHALQGRRGESGTQVLFWMWKIQQFFSSGVK